MSSSFDELIAFWEKGKKWIEEEKESEKEKARRERGGGGGEEAPKKMVSEGEPIIMWLFQANQSIWFL